MLLVRSVKPNTYHLRSPRWAIVMTATDSSAMYLSLRYESVAVATPSSDQEDTPPPLPSPYEIVEDDFEDSPMSEI